MCFTTLNFLSFNALHSQQFKNYLDNDIIGKNTSSDSVLPELNKIHNEARIEKDSITLINSLISLSAYGRNHLDYETAFNNSGKALFLAEELQDTLLMAKAHEELGVLSYLFKQDDDVGHNFNKSHTYYQWAFNKKLISSSTLFDSYYNQIMYYQRIEDAGSLLKYIDSCAILAKENKTLRIHQIYLDEKISSIESWNGNYESALKLLKNSVSKIETLNPDQRIIHDNFLTILYSRIGQTYLLKNEPEMARIYFEKSFQSQDTFNEVTFYRSFVYGQYAALMSELGYHAKAYESLQKSNDINNRYLNPRNDENSGFLIIRNQYQEQIDKKNKILNTQKNELTQRTQSILRFRILLFIVIFIIVILALVIRARIKHIKHQKVERSSKELIDIKNKELTGNTLQLIEKDEIIKKLSGYIKKNHSDSSSKSLLKSIENQSESLWEAFNRRFTAQNIGFYERLQKKIPDLSAADLKICALIKLNFTGKEMAYLLGISLGSVHVARHRLRKKIKLERDVNLTNFINSI